LVRCGVLLILTALTLFVLKAKYTSHGVLLLGGVIAMIFGAIFLIRSPLTAGGVSIGTAIAVTLPFAGISVLLMRLVLRSRKWKPATGREELLREQGVAVSGRCDTSRRSERRDTGDHCVRLRCT